MPKEGIDVQLGRHEYRVQPQRHAYLKRELRKFFGSLGELSDMDAENLLDVFTQKAYSLLSVFIPDLMPEHEFEGYSDETAMDADDYHEEFDHSPTPPQIKEAFRAAVMVNDLDWVGQLKNFIGTDLIRAQMRAQMAQWAASQQSPKTISTPASESSQPQNGASTPASSGTPDPTPAAPLSTS